VLLERVNGNVGKGMLQRTAGLESRENGGEDLAMLKSVKKGEGGRFSKVSQGWLRRHRVMI